MNSRVVLDTNILVSGLLSPTGNPARIIDLTLGGMLQLYYDSRILFEYERVLTAPKFPFDAGAVRNLMTVLMEMGFSVIPPPIDIPFEDETDKKFYEVARAADAWLITGNLKHYPIDPTVVTPSGFLKLYTEQ